MDPGEVRVAVTLVFADRGQALDVEVPARAPLAAWVGALASALGLAGDWEVVAFPSRPPAPAVEEEPGPPVPVPLAPGDTLAGAGVWDGSWLVVRARQAPCGRQAGPACG